MQTNKPAEVYLSLFDGMLVNCVALGIVALGISAFIEQLLPKASAEGQMVILLMGVFLLAISLPGLYKYRREPVAYAMLAWILFIFGALAGIIWLVNTYVPFKILAGIGLAVAVVSLLYVYVLRPPEREATKDQG